MTVSIELIDRASVKVQALPETLRSRLRVIIVRDVQLLAATVREKLSGEILHIRTGKLLASVHATMDETPDAIWGRVYDDDVKAAILEWGGKTRPHMIYPVSARALRFMAGGQEVFAKKVNHPGSVIPAFAYMRTSLSELQDRLTSDMLEATRS